MAVAKAPPRPRRAAPPARRAAPPGAARRSGGQHGPRGGVAPTPPELTPRRQRPLLPEQEGPLICALRVELRGLEPLTPTLPVWCATSCATAPLDVPRHF